MIKFAKRKKDFVIVAFFILIFIAIRTLNFSEVLNFSTDQAEFSLKALNIWQTEENVLLGPPISISFAGRQVFQGAAIYYFQLIFLLLGNFDPVRSSYIFMVFASLMVMPFYFGIKNLMNRRAAILAAIFYSLLPFFVDYTRFMWNPTFQFSLFPLVIYVYSLYSRQKRKLYLLVFSFLLGFLLQFHYGFLLVILGFLILLLFKKISFYSLLVFEFGLFLGFWTILLFEVRNNFYNFRTLLFYLDNWSQVWPKFFGDSDNQNHYKLAITFFGILAVLSKFYKKISTKFIIVIFFVLLVWSGVKYLPKPAQAFGMAKNWNYLYEDKTSKIILEQSIDSFNVTNLGYDTLAKVQKYLLKIHGVQIDQSNYETNKYLFVISSKEDFLNNPAYEIQIMKPFVRVFSWKINDYFKLYLIKRV